MLIDYVKCTCCGACVDACPQNCIALTDFHNGFLYPQIDSNRCINCKKCESVCHVSHEIKGSASLLCVAVQSKDDMVLEHATSGGMFLHLVKVLPEGAYVVGAVYDEQMVVKHEVLPKSDVHKFCGSKYNRSETVGIFTEVKKILDNGKKVMFTGVPCQISALKAYLGKNCENLITCELFCHGQPSDLLFRKYVKNLEKKYSSKLVSYCFRSKSKGWDNQRIVYRFANGKEVCIKPEQDANWMAFGFHLSLMDSCFHCRYRILERQADFSIGDFWGIENIKQNFNIKKGVSALLINTDKGQRMFNRIRSEVNYVTCSFEEISLKNTGLYKNFSLTPKRALFWKDYETMPIDRLLTEYSKFDNGIRYKLAVIKKELVRHIKLIKNRTEI